MQQLLLLLQTCPDPDILAASMRCLASWLDVDASLMTLMDHVKILLQRLQVWDPTRTTLLTRRAGRHV